jgi:hypothetical protein
MLAVIVGACVLLSVIVVWRSRHAGLTPESAPVPGSFGSRKSDRAARGPGDVPFSSGGGFAPSGGAPIEARPGEGALPADLRRLPPGQGPQTGDTGRTGGAVAPPKLADVGENTVASADGRKLAAEPVPVMGKVDGVMGWGATNELPEGLLFAAAFNGTGEAADGTLPIIEDNVYYDAGEGVYFPPDSRFAYPDNGNVDNEGGTFSLWIQPVDWDGAEKTDNSFFQLRAAGSWPNRLQLFKNGYFLRFLFTNAAGIETNIGAVINTWKKGEWHHVAGTWGEGQTTMYVDGRLIDKAFYEGGLEVPDGTPLYVGSDLPGGASSAGANISKFAVLERVLAPEEISILSSDHPSG